MEVKKSKIAVILFAKDEAQHIAKVIKELKRCLKELPPAELFIYDDSKDDTLKIAEKEGFTPLRGFNVGLGWAYYTALHSLSSKDRFQTFIALDADGQTDFQELPVFYKEFQKGYDLIVGSRFLRKGSFAYRYPKVNFFGVKILSFLITLAALQRFTDSHGGMRIMTSRVAGNLRFLGSHSYVQETIIESVRRGFFVKEMPCYWRKRAYGKSRVVHSYMKYALKMGGPLLIRARFHWIVMIMGCLTGLFLKEPLLFSAFLLLFGMAELWGKLKFIKNRKQLKYYVRQLPRLID